MTNGGSVGKTDGTDILFTDSSGTLKKSIMNWKATTRSPGR